MPNYFEMEMAAEIAADLVRRRKLQESIAQRNFEMAQWWERQRQNAYAAEPTFRHPDEILSSPGSHPWIPLDKAMQGQRALVKPSGSRGRSFVDEQSTHIRNPSFSNSFEERSQARLKEEKEKLDYIEAEVLKSLGSLGSIKTQQKQMKVTGVACADQCVTDLAEHTEAQIEKQISRVKGPEAYWDVPFTVEKLQEMTRVYGDAIHPVKTFNKVLYRLRELIRGARTLTRTPILLNHIETRQDAIDFLRKWGGHAKLDQRVRRVVEAIAKGERDVTGGRVDFADWSDESNSVKYAATIQDSDYEGLVNSGLVHSVSIGARPVLGYEDESKLIPAGIIFEDLSIITDPLKPADPQATIKVLESWGVREGRPIASGRVA